jgi:hypothetical protein
MALKSNPGKAQKAPPARPTKVRGELEAKDLDKVTGGLRKSGGPRPGDPCDGGE